MIKIKIRKDIGKKKYLLYAVISFIAVFLAWFLVSESGLLKEIFLPKPKSVIRYYIDSIKDGSLWANTKISVYRISLGFIYAVILGIPVGILVGTFKKFEAVLRPPVRVYPIYAYPCICTIDYGLGRYRGKRQNYGHLYRYIFPTGADGSR